MEKLNLHSPDLTACNVDKVAKLFPTVVTETGDADGNPVRALDFDPLRQELSDHGVEGPRERYHLDWSSKREALFAANAPIAKTLRPVREESVDFAMTSADQLLRSGQLSGNGERLIATSESSGRFHYDWFTMMYLRQKLATMVSAIAERQPLRPVFRESAFETDVARSNAKQIFAERSPATDARTI